MASEHHGAGGFDLAPHTAMWNGFMKLVLYSVVAIAILLSLMAYFLT